MCVSSRFMRIKHKIENSVHSNVVAERVCSRTENGLCEFHFATAFAETVYLPMKLD